MKILLYLFVGVLSAASPVFGAEKLVLTGTVFDLSGKKKLFEYFRYHEVLPQGDSYRVVYKNMKGKVAVEQKGIVKDLKLISYTVKQEQTQSQGSIEIKGKKTHFSLTKKGGKKETNTETWAKNTVSPLNLVPVLLKNWDQIVQKGKSLDVRYAVWHRKDTVGFTFKKTKEFKENGADVIAMEMNATSFFIRQIVDPLTFTFNKKTKELLRVKGRTAPKILRKGQWEDLDALTVYSHIK